MKRVLAVFLCVALVLPVGLQSARADGVLSDATVVEDGKCGTDAFWSFMSDGELRIYGTGPMDNYQCLANWGNTAPWYDNYGSQIKKVTIEDGITTVGEAAFSNCYCLSTVTISDTVTRIESKAFYGIYDLTEVRIPVAVVYMGQEAFSMCRGLRSITVDENNLAFSGDTDGVLYNKDKTVLLLYPAYHTATTYTVYPGTTAIADYAFYDCQCCGTVVLPDGLRTIGNEAFYSADGLTGINIPSTVTSIGEKALSGCAALNRIDVDSGNAYYCADEDGVLFSKDKSTLICFPSGQAATDYTVVDGVQTIAAGAFLNSNIRSIEMPDGLTHVDSYAFEYCFDLESVRFPDSLIFIGHDAFFNALKLQYVLIPASVQTVEYRAFYHLEGTAFFEGDAPSGYEDNTFGPKAILCYREGTSGWSPSVFANNTKISVGESACLGASAQIDTYRTGAVLTLALAPFIDQFPVPETIRCYYGVYDGYKMVDLGAYDAQIEPGKVTAINLPLDENVIEGKTIRAFFLRSKSLFPLCDALRDITA